jgi:hypothetical protein
MFTNMVTLADPVELEDVKAAYPVIAFVPVPGTEDDECSGCPDQDIFGQASADAVLVYRWWGHWVRQPVGSCCISSELRDLVDNDAVTDLRVEVLVEPTDTPAGVRRPGK